jgi:alcohol dehydrogenase (cytochrome c)
MRSLFAAATLATALYAQSPNTVPYQRIVNADKEPGNWMTYSRTYDGHRYSPLTGITPLNVAGLKPLWTYQIKQMDHFETTPLAVDGVLYISEPPDTVSALDGRTGRRLWSFTHVLPPDIQVCCGRVNRGVAILDKRVYVGTLDSHLIALNASNGAIEWDTPVADYKAGLSLTMAPLAIDGKVIVGIAGGEYGIRGFIDAYDAKTGKQLWRFWTIPGPGEPGHESWHGDSWKNGGAPAWVTGSYDPELNLIYWGTGNPGPDWNVDGRGGDNLYSCSMVAIDAATGKLKWHFQFTPHDSHDYDSTEVPMLFDGVVRGKPRKVVALANRNAFYYILDRATGEFLAAKPYAHFTWTKGLDDSGRPQVDIAMEPSEKGTLVSPSLYGATNWFSPSYSPLTKLVYVSVREQSSYFFKTDVEYKPGAPFIGGGERAITGDSAYGAIRALDAFTGATKWEFKLKSPPWSGVLSTGGGLVFGGSMEGNFYALDAKTGKPLWDYQTGAEMFSNIMSYEVDGKQRIAVTSGHALFVFGLR